MCHAEMLTRNRKPDLYTFRSFIFDVTPGFSSGARSIFKCFALALNWFGLQLKRHVISNDKELFFFPLDLHNKCAEIHNCNLKMIEWVY